VLTTFRPAPLAFLVAAPLLLVAMPAAASTVTLNGSGALAPTFQFLGSASGNLMSTANDYLLGVPGQYSLLDTFTAPQSFALTGTSGTGSYAFQDTIEFTVGQSASGDVLTATLGLQGPSGAVFNVDGLQFRLYEVASGTAPTVGGLPAGATPVTSWTGLPTGQSSVTASFSGIASGTYFLDIRGTANGSSGGTYVGQINLQPVPLPLAAPLLLSGLGLLGGALRRRRLA